MHFSWGTKVEVTSNIRDSWYKATVIPRPKLNKSLWVQYDTIFDTKDPSKKLQEFTHISLIRPLPPTHSEEWNKFEKFDFVDVYCKGGWFTGVLLHVFDNGSKYLVAFLNPYEEFVWGKDEIRLHLEWLGGWKWGKVYPSQKVNVTFCPPKVGKTAVASLPESTPAVVGSEVQAPSPAKKEKQTEGRPSSDPNYVVQSVDPPHKFFQPCSLPSCKDDTNITGKMKACDEQNWEDIKKNDDSHSRCPAKGNQITEVIDLTDEPDEVVDKHVSAPSPAKKLKRTTSGDAVGRPSSDPNYVVQSVDVPPKFLQPSSLSPSKGDTHSNGKRKASEGQSYSPLSLSPRKEDNKKNYAHSPAKGNQGTQVVDAIDAPEKDIGNQGDRGSKSPVSFSEPAATECPKACPVTTCFSPQSDNSQSWPFTKKSEMWKVYESMEVFKKISQAPHFSLLNEHEEKSREMLALCMMSNFSYEAERILAGSPDDLDTSRIILDSLKSLEELEAHGFNITPLQDYLIELLFKMDKEKELKRELEEIEKGIAKCQDEKAAIERKVSELANQLKSLQEQIWYETSAKYLKAKYLKDRQLAIMKSHRDIIFRKLHRFQLTMKPPFKW